jgi:hypothetical protein
MDKNTLVIPGTIVKATLTQTKHKRDLNDKILNYLKYNGFEDKSKGDYRTLLNQEIVVTNFRLDNHPELGENVKFVIENDENYYCCGCVAVVDTFKELLTYIHEIKELGLAVKLEEKVSKAKRKYIAITILDGSERKE